MWVWGVILLTAVALLLRVPLRAMVLPLALTLTYIILAVMTTVHEIGHAAAAAMTGIRVRGIALGAGPRLLSLQTGSFTLTLHVVPIGGRTTVEAATRAVRTRHVVVTLAGPAVEAASVFIAIGLVPSWLGATLLYLWALSFVTNVLIPLPRAGNDGWAFWRLLTMPDEEVDALAESASHDRDARLLNDTIRGLAAVDPTVLERIRADMAARSELPGNDPGLRAIALSNLAAVDLLLERSELIAEADAASAEAMAIVPWVAEVASTRGAVLVALGADEEARLMLEEVLSRPGSTAKASAHANLALLAARRGDAFATRVHLAKAEAVAGLPAYRAALSLAGELELEIVCRYWISERDAAAAAEAVRRDAGNHAAMIGRTLTHLISTRDGADVEGLIGNTGSSDGAGSLTAETVASIAAHLMPGSPSSRDR